LDAASGTLRVVVDTRNVTTGRDHLGTATLTFRSDGALANMIVTRVRIEWYTPAAVEPGANVTINFPTLTDQAPADAAIIRGGSFSLATGGTITVQNPAGDIRWFLDGEELVAGISGDHDSVLTLTGGILGPYLGTRFVTVAVERDGRLYGRRIAIEVTL
jgi:hypothetical protein